MAAELLWLCPKCGPVSSGYPGEVEGEFRCPSEKCDRVIKFNHEPKRRAVVMSKPAIHAAVMDDPQARERASRASVEGRRQADEGRALLAQIEERERMRKARATGKSYRPPKAEAIREQEAVAPRPAVTKEKDMGRPLAAGVFDLDKLKKLKAQGKTDAECGEALGGVRRGTIRRWCEKYEIVEGSAPRAAEPKPVKIEKEKVMPKSVTKASQVPPKEKKVRSVRVKPEAVEPEAAKSVIADRAAEIKAMDQVTSALEDLNQDSLRRVLSYAYDRLREKHGTGVGGIALLPAPVTTTSP